MPVDLTKIEPLLQQAMTKVLTPGELSSEYAAAKSTGRIGMLIAALGILTTIAAPVADAFSGTRIGVWAGIVLTIAGAIVKLISSVHYVGGRVDVKASISDVLDSVGTIVKTVADANRPPAAPIVVNVPATAPTPVALGPA